ncbi:MAG: peptide deformylase [Chloroflexi bacterium]|nr:peptide deformylase [Chloroflexota bacterium]
MALREILHHPDERLRVKCKRVGSRDIGLHRLIDDLFETMEHARGVGLAAPQVGVPLRVTVVRIPEDYDDPAAGQDIALINPEIVKSTGEWEPDEGCLSIPGYVANVRRNWAVTVNARDRRWREFRIRGDGLLGQALQHEIDHLDGVLFVDRLESPDQLRPLERTRDDPAGAA